MPHMVWNHSQYIGAHFFLQQWHLTQTHTFKFLEWFERFRTLPILGHLVLLHWMNQTHFLSVQLFSVCVEFWHSFCIVKHCKMSHIIFFVFSVKIRIYWKGAGKINAHADKNTIIWWKIILRQFLTFVISLTTKTKVKTVWRIWVNSQTELTFCSKDFSFGDANRKLMSYISFILFERLCFFSTFVSLDNKHSTFASSCQDTNDRKLNECSTWTHMNWEQDGEHFFRSN